MTTSAHSDAELLARARQGDETAFAELYVRHEAAALRLARGYPRAGDPDDLVAESFTRILRALRQGAGPTEAFRAYLFVTLRRIAAARIARRQDDPYDEVPEPVRAEAGGAGGPGDAEAEADDRRMVVAAYESLPSRWQSVLWHTAVEGHPPRDVGPTLGMSANAAAALAYRAREKLRQAYLQAHLRVTSRPECEPHRSRLGAYVRQGLGTRARAATDDHIGECAACRSLVGELSDIDQLLVRSMVPFFVATASISGAAGSAGAAAGAASRRGARNQPPRPGLAERPGAIAAVVVAAAALVTVMVTVLTDRTSPPAPLDLPPVPASRPAPSGSDDVALPIRPDRGGTGADQPDEPASAPAPRSDGSTVTGSPPFVSPSASEVDRSRGAAGSAVPIALSRPVVTAPPPVAVPGPPPTTSPVPPPPPVTQSPTTTSPPTTPPAPPPVTTTVPVPVTTTTPPPPAPPADPDGDLFGCGCDILGSILRSLL